MTKKYAMGIDIGGTNTAFGLVDEDGNVIADSKISTDKFKYYDDYKPYMETLAASMKELIASQPECDLIGIGIGAPNANIHSGKIETPANLWKFENPADPRPDTIRIFNNHLYTTSISKDDSEDIARGKILQDGDRMRSIVNRIADNSSIRAAHVDTLRYIMDNTPYRQVVCGDFNDTPMSYVYGRLSENLYDVFVESGNGYGYTFRPMYGMLRIDYILYSGGIEPLNYNANTEVIHSDHLPVTAQFRLEKKGK